MSAGRPAPSRLRALGLALLPALGLPLTLLAARRGWVFLLYKPHHEWLAPPLLALSTLLWGRAARRLRDTIYWAVTLLTFALGCREVHFFGTNQLVQVAAFATLWFCWRRRRELRARLGASAELRWYAAALWGYVLSQLVARRVFKGPATEQRVHVPLEEMIETIGHLMVLVAALIATRRARTPAGARAAGVETRFETDAGAPADGEPAARIEG